MTKEQDTTGDEARQLTWQERYAQAQTAAAKHALDAKWKAARAEIEKAQIGNDDLGSALLGDVAQKAIDRWSCESRGIAPKQYAKWELLNATAPIGHKPADDAKKTDLRLRKHQVLTGQDSIDESASASGVAEDEEPHHDLESLKEATIYECKRRYGRMTCQRWDDRPEWLKYALGRCWIDDDQKIEKAASDALVALREALLALRALPPEGGGVRATWARHMARGLRSVDIDVGVIEYDDPKDHRLDINERGLGLKNFRQKLAAFWPNAAPDVRACQHPDLRTWPLDAPPPVAGDLAVVAILAGDWPSDNKWKPSWVKGETPSSVIKSVTAGFTGPEGAIAKAAQVTQDFRAFSKIEKKI